jgi:hypothetical protein
MLELCLEGEIRVGVATWSHWSQCWLVSLVGLVGKSADTLVVVMLVGGFCNTWALTGGGGRVLGVRCPVHCSHRCYDTVLLLQGFDRLQFEISVSTH